MSPPNAEEALRAENAALHARLEETEETLRSIRAGEVDALVVEGAAGPQVFVLQSADAESNRFRSDILAKVSDAVVAVDDARRVIYLNAAAELQYGVPAAEALGRPLTELFETCWIEPEDEARANAALAGQGHWRGKVVHVRRDGEAVRVEVAVSCLQTHDDAPPGRLSVIRDITAQSAVEEARRESEERYRTLFGSMDEGFCIIEMLFDAAGRPSDYRFLEVNPAFEKQTGLREATGRTVRELVPRHDEHWFEIYGRVALTGEPVRLENRAEGLNRWYEVHASRFGAAAKRQVAVLFNDVTERRLAEIALRASEQRATDIVQSIADGFLTMDREWRITYLSARGAEILSPLQKTVSNVLSKVFWEEFPATVGTEIEAGYRRAVREQQPVQFETYYPPLERWFELRAYPSASGMSLFFLDINERKQAEEALARQADALRTADRSKDEFLAMLAHELRNPLAPLSNAAELLCAIGTMVGEREEAQQVIRRQIGNMSRMIDDLLDVSRITEGKIELRRRPVALAAVLNSALGLVRAGCATRGQELTVALPAEPIWLEADATRLEQVFGNLLGNASKYGGPGCHITLRAKRDGGEVAVCVCDDGAGIDPALLPNIFGLFVQASRTLDRAHGGLGIGLTLVQRLVRLHGGTVEASSDGLGHGAEFIVRLPVLAEPPPTPAPAAPAVRDTARRILIVDDNEDSARSLATLQRRRGHETRTAFAGPEGLLAAEKFRPEVVLLDIGLPGMDGYEVARRLRAMPAAADALIVAMTGYGSAADQALARAAGFDEHLTKPVDLERLRGILRATRGADGAIFTSSERSADKV